MPIEPSGVVSDRLLSLGIDTFLSACRWVHELPYGYNADRNDLMILFKEKMGSCTTKHALIATLAEELKLPVEKNIAIYDMTEEIATGTDRILQLLSWSVPLHCFFMVNNRDRIKKSPDHNKVMRVDNLAISYRWRFIIMMSCLGNRFVRLLKIQIHEVTIDITAGLSIVRRINLSGALNLLRPSCHPVPDVPF